ncbi:hypothetical protein Syun_021948 [Stephania yunnanensis]|uniref:TRF2/HOY1 PH-like domain-containing protein n=1 Tax=Stephania yunnanensis TaxID=152371 RepID=A0AAP0NSQ4_9MAGN
MGIPLLVGLMASINNNNTNNNNNLIVVQVVGARLGNFSGTTSPLGLTLTKTPSFLELVESKISKKYDSTSADESSDESKKRKAKNGEVEKLKASNISASRLRIGLFERESKNDGDLVAKCYYAKRKLVWEMLEGGLKNKIEINWSEITAIKAVFPKNQPSVLEIQLSHMPSFQRESDPQPRKHTIWHATPDFTGGQASLNRMHWIQFREGELEKHYEKLLQCDKRLLMLSQKPFPYYDPPLFDNKNHSGHEEFALEFIGHQPGYAPAMQYPHINIQRHHPAPFYPQTPHMFQPSCRPVNVVHLNSSLPPYMLERENQVIEQQPLYAYPNQEDHAFTTNAAYPLGVGVRVRDRFPNFHAVEDHLMSDQVAPICGEDQLQLKRKNSWYSILDAAGGENNSVQTYPNYNMQMDSIREPSADTYSSWSSEQSVGYDDFSFQDSGNWSTSPSPNSTLHQIHGGLEHFNVNLNKANIMRRWSR